jgi:hypothetical protein
MGIGGMHTGFWWEIQRSIGRPSHRWEENIKLNLRKLGLGGLDSSGSG